MRVAIYYNNNDVRLEEVPTPKINAGELLVKVIASGLCGSDVMEWYRTKKAPLVLGHEITGEVVKVGEGVKNHPVGERVFVSHHVPCNACHYCLSDHHTACETLHTTNYDPGGFAQYIRVPKINVESGVYPLPDNVSFADGTFVEPLACVVRGQRLAYLKPNQTVLIMGSGISGLLHLKLARASGVKRIIATDINDYRLQKASQFGATATIYAQEDVPSRLRELNEGRLADLVIVCAGAPQALNQALECGERGSTILFFAVAEPGFRLLVPINNFWRNEMTIMTSYGASPADLKEALDLIGSGKVVVGDMITHRLSLAEIAKGFKLTAEAKESLKVIIEPQR